MCLDTWFIKGTSEFKDCLITSLTLRSWSAGDKIVLVVWLSNYVN
jgi:hypothetical protein